MPNINYNKLQHIFSFLKNKSNKLKKTIKVFFANKFREIKHKSNKKNILSHTYINEIQDTDDNNTIHKVTRAKDSIPEYLGIIDEIDASKVKNLNHLNGAPRDIGTGSFSSVYMAAQDNLDIKKDDNAATESSAKISISPILVKKEFNDLLYKEEDSKQEHQKNKLVGTLSVLDVSNNAIISSYKGESLDNLLTSKTIASLTDNEKINLSQQLLEQVKVLHDKGILHGNIKPTNIVIDSKGKLSIIDFGIRGVNPDNKPDYTFVYDDILSTPRYTDPASFTSKEKTLSFDSWSVGANIYEIFTGKELLNKDILYIDDVTKKTIFNSQLLKIKLANIQQNSKIPQQIKELLARLLTIDSKNRAKIEDVLKLDIFKEKDLPEKTLIELHLLHDKNFKRLAYLEDQLEIEEKNPNASEDTKQSLEKEIGCVSLYYHQLDNEIKNRGQKSSNLQKK